MDFDAAAQILTIYSAFIKCLKQNWEYNETVHQLLIDCKKSYDSVMWEDLYTCNMPIEFGIPMKLVRLIEMCLNE